MCSGILTTTLKYDHGYQSFMCSVVHWLTDVFLIDTGQQKSMAQMNTIHQAFDTHKNCEQDELILVLALHMRFASNKKKLENQQYSTYP